MRARKQPPAPPCTARTTRLSTGIPEMDHRLVSLARSRCPPSAASSRRVPRQPLDARHDLPEQNPCQAAFGKLQDEVSGMPNEAATGLEEPLLSVLWYYDVVYWSGSQGTHASPIAVETYLSTSSTGQPSYKLGLSVARARARSTVSPTERDGSLLERRPAPAPGARGFERRRRPEHGEVGEAAADDLQAPREAGRAGPRRGPGARLARAG